MRPVLLSLAALLLLVASPASAQFDDTLWGVSGTFVPSWKAPTQVGVVFGTESSPTAEEFSLEGSSFSIGFVRGRALGGEWGLSVVRTSIKDGSFARRKDGSLVRTDGNSVLGGAIHTFIPFGTIKQRVQIGMTLGIGAGQVRGPLDVTDAGGVESSEEGKDLLNIDGTTIPVWPMAKAELAVAAIITRGLKVRANVGVNFPGYQKFSLTGTYFFGAK
jgi:hypothetical protein